MDYHHPRQKSWPIHSNRPHFLATWLRKLVHVLEVEELGALGTAIKATKIRYVLGRPHSLLRGPIPGETAAGKVPARVWWLILDYDHGRRPIDRERLAPYLHFVWTTMSHEPGSPAERVAIPIVPATDAAGHDWLLDHFMHDYPKHHDDLMRAALLPVRRFDRSGRCSDVRIWANLGELLRPPSPITMAATTPLPDPSPVPSGGFRLANALKANVEAVCRFVGIKLPAFTHTPQDDTKIQIHCPINPDHPDPHESATVTIFAKDTHDVWVSCHACPTKGQRVTMPIADLFWLRQFKAPGIKRLRPTKAQRLVYAARLLHEAECARQAQRLPLGLSYRDADQVGMRALVPSVYLKLGGKCLKFTYRGKVIQVAIHALDVPSEEPTYCSPVTNMSTATSRPRSSSGSCPNGAA